MDNVLPLPYLIHYKLTSYRALLWLTLQVLSANVYKLAHIHCVKTVRIWSYSGPYFPAYLSVFSPNAGKWGPE